MFGSIGNIANIAFTAVGTVFGGPIGGLVTQLARQAIAEVMDGVIEQLPIPDTYKDLMQAGFHAAFGNTPGVLRNVDEFLTNFGAQFGGSAVDVANMQRSVDEFQQDATEILTNLINDTARDREDAAAPNGRASGGGNSTGAAGWLRALAEAMGKKLDELAHDMQAKAEAIDKDDPSTSVDFQVASQQFQIVMNAASTALKAVGEGMTATARKQ